MYEVHDFSCNRYRDVKITLKDVTKSYYWPSIKKDIE